MAIHLRKLCVGISNIQDLQQWQNTILQRKNRIFHRTRNTPKRQLELLDGGSIYWIIKAKYSVRQCIIGFEREEAEEVIANDPQKPAKPHCLIILDPKLIAVEPRPHRIFQGWRYLEPENTPRDLTKTSQEAIEELGIDMADELRNLGIKI